MSEQTEDIQPLGRDAETAQRLPSDSMLMNRELLQLLGQEESFRKGDI